MNTWGRMSNVRAWDARAQTALKARRRLYLPTIIVGLDLQYCKDASIGQKFTPPTFALILWAMN